MARCKALDNKISGCRQTPENIPTVFGLQAEGHTPLVETQVEPFETLLRVVDVVIEWRCAARGASAGRLDLDNVRAEVTKELAAEHPTTLGKIEDPAAA